MCQEPGERADTFVQRFRNAQCRCRSNLAKSDCVKMVISGLNLENRKKFIGQDFFDLGHLMTAVSKYERILEEENQRRVSSRGTYYRNPNREVAQIEAMEESEETEEEIVLAELNINRPYKCRALVKSKVQELKQNFQRRPNNGSQSGNNFRDKKYNFDLSKIEQIFDLLLKDGQIKLPDGHKIPSAEEMKDKKYCKWHDCWTHPTNSCIVLRDAIQRSINSEKLKFPEEKTVHQVNENHFPFEFPINMVVLQVQNSDMPNK